MTGQDVLILEVFGMGTVIFLLLTAVAVAVVLFLTERSRARAGREANRSRRKAEAQKLAVPTDTKLSHKRQLWAARREKARKGINEPKPFVPQFEKRQEAMYDGYSRRARHHVTPAAEVKKEARVKDLDKEFKLNGITVRSSGSSSPADTRH
jgi:hypothetical protein